MVPQTLFQDFRVVTQPRNSIVQIGKLPQKRKGPECKILPPRGAARTGLNSLKGAPLFKGKACHAGQSGDVCERRACPVNTAGTGSPGPTLAA